MPAVVNIRSFISMVRAAPEELTEAAEDAMLDGAHAVAGRLRSITPVRTGRMRRSVFSRAVPDGAEVGYDANIADYAAIVNVVHARAPFLQAALEAELPAVQARVERAVAKAAAELEARP